VDQAFREGITRGLTQPRRSLYSEIAREKRGPIAQDILDHAHRGIFKPCPTVLDAAQKLTICLLSEDYPPPGEGNPGSVTCDLACGLAKRGHMVHVLTRSSCGHNTVDFENEVWVHRLVQDSPPPDAEAGAAPAGKQFTVLVRELRRIHGTHPIDIVEKLLSERERSVPSSDGRFVLLAGALENLEQIVAQLLAESTDDESLSRSETQPLGQRSRKEKLADLALASYHHVLSSRPRSDAGPRSWVGIRSAGYSPTVEASTSTTSLATGKSR